MEQAMAWIAETAETMRKKQARKPLKLSEVGIT